MGDQAPAPLLARGGIRTVTTSVPVPVLYHFPGSFNSGKAKLAAEISQKGSVVIDRWVFHMRDNYTPAYVRLNPDTMAVPTMEIDDKVITESHEIVRYLFEHYPGPGDREVQASGRSKELWAFVGLARSWDEYMFTYGHMGAGVSDMANNIRLANLRYFLSQVLRESPEDQDSLVSAYVNKISGVMTMNRATGGEARQSEKERDLEANRALLDRVLAAGSGLLGARSGFLFGDHLSTADACFLPIFRIFHIAMPTMFEEVFDRYPTLRGYWERATASAEVRSGLLKCVRKSEMAYRMLRARAPKTILAYKLGLLRAPKLPDDVERRIEEVAEQKWRSVRG